MKTLKKVPIVPLIIGLLLVVYAIVSYFVNKPPVFHLGGKIGLSIIGLTLIAFALIIVLPKVGNKGSKSASTLRLVEFVIIVMAALIGFLLPVFDVNINLGKLFSGSSFWIGFALVMFGGVELFLGSHSKASVKGSKFFISILSVIAGTYIYAKNLVDARKISFIALLGLGIYLFAFGLVYLSKKNK